MQLTHTSVLLEAVLNNLIRIEDRVFVDATLGGGGHAYGILDQCRELVLIGIDADEDALQRAEQRLSPFRERIRLRKGNFRDLKKILTAEGIGAVDGILFDLGISMFQMMGGRGFSFNDEDSLDMRIDPDTPITAFDVVNHYSYVNLKRIIEEYGEEWEAPRIARALIEARKKRPLESAKEVAAVIEKVKRRRGKIHPATQTFQALRIEVNQELENLKMGLSEATDVLSPGGRVGVITFHSIEDRVVKNVLRTSSELRVLTKKALKPDRAETRQNPRARSAKLRIAEKLGGRGMI
ncbi:MAG TPA: 16S rRNA (cytosine(1402)-N(4))-methyltransferase [Deltaproteobacteria bacterium]|nr:16S rRNA (cytosine(1402)-N(4))-methyltransferase [Deltaproteobacteria bacterium]